MKVIFESLEPRRNTRSTPHSVEKKRVALGDGRSKTVYRLDANSPTFDADLQYVFSRNVAKARRENKRLFGSPE
jgi:hypothetical protein